MVFRTTAHAAYDTAYHLVWSPKYQKEILQGAIADRVREMFQEIADNYDFTIEEMEVSRSMFIFSARFRRGIR